jgi:hypothetical protein
MEPPAPLFEEGDYRRQCVERLHAEPAFHLLRECAQRAFRSSRPEPTVTISVRRSGPPRAECDVERKQDFVKGGHGIT